MSKSLLILTLLSVQIGLKLASQEWKIAPSSEDYDTDFDPETSTDHVQFDPETSVINIRLSLLKDLPTNESSLDFYVISALYSGGKYRGDASFLYEISENAAQYSTLELEYRPWNNLEVADTLSCEDDGTLNNSRSVLIETLTWNMKRGADLVIVDREWRSNVTVCTDENITWGETIEHGGVDMLRVILYDNAGDLEPNKTIKAEFRILPNECKTLPWPMMRLDPTFSFPIKSGTHVPIVCPDPGYIQTGDSTVYCEGGSVFHFENLPACIGGRDEQHESWGYVTWNLGHVTLLMSRSSFCKNPMMTEPSTAISFR
ncbi:hypothetical protein ACHWQZ_G001650 [Mnemiopsis leidyi]